jgi:hypothetical protein
MIAKIYGKTTRFVQKTSDSSRLKINNNKTAAVGSIDAHAISKGGQLKKEVGGSGNMG